MSKMGMIIGGHSVTHTLMTKLSINKAKNEIQQSRIFLKKFTKRILFFVILMVDLYLITIK